MVPTERARLARGPKQNSNTARKKIKDFDGLRSG